MIHQICRRFAIVFVLTASVAVPPLSAQNAGPDWYTFCVGGVGPRADLYLSDIFAISRDALAGLAVQNNFKAFLQDRYAKPRNTVVSNVSCLTNRLPKEEQVRRRKDDQISNYAQFHKEPGSGTIIETHWTPAGAPADETAPEPSAASSAPTSSQPSPPSGTGSTQSETLTPEAAPPPADPRLDSLPPATRTAVLDEAKSNQSYCESHAGLSNQYDCACYARQLLIARLDAGAKVAYAAGGRRVMIPNAASLVANAKPTSCSH